MKSPEVQRVCTEMWDLRQQGGLTRESAGKWSRDLILASGDDVEADPDYEPAADQRLRWALDVLEQVRRSEPFPKASADSEAMASFLLERAEVVPLCGKDLAAGD